MSSLGKRRESLSLRGGDRSLIEKVWPDALVRLWGQARETVEFLGVCGDRSVSLRGSLNLQHPKDVASCGCNTHLMLHQAGTEEGLEWDWGTDILVWGMDSLSV